MTVAVVIATFNRASRIARTLDSVRCQSVPASEIIVVDDGSTDTTADWIESHYPEVRLVRTRNGGTSSARNRGAREATSDVLMFLDHDDELLPQAVGTMTALLRQWPRARAAFADHTYKNCVSGQYWPNHHFTQPPFSRLRGVPAIARADGSGFYGRRLYQALLRGNLLQQPWAVYREEFLSVGGFATDVRYCEDWDIYLRVTAAVSVAVSDAVISNHFVEGNNLHLAPGQEEMQMKVLRRQIAATKAGDLTVLIILRCRLAMYYKSAGDLARPGDLRQAWLCYFRSFALWPFDHVVAARTLLWLLRLSAGRAQVWGWIKG